jgi:RecB family exonuclease
VDRLVEHPLNGPFQFPRLSGLLQVGIEIRGKADRIDVFDDGTLRVIDYKLGRLPDPTSIQIGVYAHCVRQALEARDGRPYTVGAAMYLAFGDDRQLEGKLGDRSQSPALAVEARASEFAGAVSRIESGAFPPRPRNTSDCQWCPFAGVCRKEYRLESENDEAAEPV